MKILSAAQMLQADQATIEKQGISSLDLMERAAKRCYEWILSRYGNFEKVTVFCGSGNNGGDGLVIARLLQESGFSTAEYALEFSRTTDDFRTNLHRWESAGNKTNWIRGQQDMPSIDSDSLVVDALFGIGLNRAPEGLVRELIVRINGSGAPVVSIDIPSGLFADRPVIDKEAVIRASVCLSFQNPKLAFFLPENEAFLKEWVLIDIGLDKDHIESLASGMDVIDLAYGRDLLRERKKFSHKGTFGHSLIIGGSFGKIGAVVLASKAALRVGSGLVSAYIPKCGYHVLQASNPEVMVEVDNENYLEYFNFKTSANAIGIGPGLGTHLKTKKGFVSFLRAYSKPVVMDADALNIIAEHEEIADMIPENSVLTPHPGEFKRLVGDWENDHDKLDRQLKFSQEHKCVIVLKGAYTSIAFEGRLYFNSTGNPALATAGSGDVLTGMITGLMAQGYKPLEAALLGVYLHGRAADLGVDQKESEESYLASDCFHFLGKAFKELRQ